MTFPSTTCQVQHTLWLWPTGLYPRRILYYLRAKHRTPASMPTLLQKYNINLIPVVLNWADGTFVPAPGHEARPPNTSLPCLRISSLGGVPVFIHESSAILEYLEDLLEREEGARDLRGSTAEQRARTRDVVFLMNDLLRVISTALIHSDESTLSWSGLCKEQQSAAAADDCFTRARAIVGKLEQCFADALDKKCKSLTGDGVDVSLADLAILAQMEYMENIYGRDVIGWSTAVKQWRELKMKEPWFISKQQLEEVEKEGFENVLF